MGSGLRFLRFAMSVFARHRLCSFASETQGRTIGPLDKGPNWQVDREGPGSDEMFFYFFDPFPQNQKRMLTREEVSSAIDGIYKMFNDHPGCEEWIFSGNKEQN